MDKISGIIPSNARTRSVDTSGSQPVRPGAPSWGRPQGRVTKANQGIEIEDRVSLSEDSAGPKMPMIYKPAADGVKVKIAEDVASKFANINPKQVARESDLTSSELLTQSLSEA